MLLLFISSRKPRTILVESAIIALKSIELLITIIVIFMSYRRIRSTVDTIQTVITTKRILLPFSKIIIYANYKPKDKDNLQTVVMRTEGLRVTHLLYLDKANTVKNDKKAVKNELRSELFDDMYDPNDLVIKAKEIANGEHGAIRIANFITKIYDKKKKEDPYCEDDLILYYGE